MVLDAPIRLLPGGHAATIKTAVQHQRQKLMCSFWRFELLAVREKLSK